MSRKQDAEKARYWQRTIREAARSGISVREFCRLRKLKVSQFYWWQHRLKETGQPRTARKPGAHGGPPSFALVSQEPGATDAGIELVLGDRRRLRIRRGVDEATLCVIEEACQKYACSKGCTVVTAGKPMQPIDKEHLYCVRLIRKTGQNLRIRPANPSSAF